MKALLQGSDPTQALLEVKVRTEGWYTESGPCSVASPGKPFRDLSY